MSMSDVSDMLHEIYRANAAAKMPKSQGTQQQAVETAAAASVKYVNQIPPTSAEAIEPSTIAVIASNSAASETASKNLTNDGMMASKLAASFHPRNNCTDSNSKVPPPPVQNDECNISL
ncbi:Longitudinals lacking protein, isoform G [Eumeta japonica]|uniref:Longitudinals lacking protein, isoform G n=1 Tax=Eumeta variegata TaxID=151549 RepID=A0A4C2AHL4_EUMVA|nr:Longitudinals lacking protein, isoform G [Eumeta japonica]